MRKFLILAVFTLKLLVANSQVDSVKSIITTKIIGQFLITTHDSIEVLVKLDKVKYEVKYVDNKNTYFDEADVSIRIEDKNEKVYYKNNLATTGNALREIKSIELPGIGKALIFVYEMFPCLGKGCDSFQIFGFNELGYFVPFTGIIDLNMNVNAEKFSHFKFKWMDNHGTEVPVQKKGLFHSNDSNNRLYIEVPDIFILSEVQTLTYYPIYTEGLGLWTDKGYKQDNFGKPPVFYNNSNIIVIDNMDKMDNERFKDPKILYTQPNTMADYKLVFFKINTVIKLLDMTSGSESWVHLVIDGIEGYMTYSDFLNSGFQYVD